MLATVIVNIFVCAISVGLFAIAIYSWLNWKNNKDCDRVYRGECDTRRALRYAIHQVEQGAH